MYTYIYIYISIYVTQYATWYIYIYIYIYMTDNSYLLMFDRFLIFGLFAVQGIIYIYVLQQETNTKQIYIYIYKCYSDGPPRRICTLPAASHQALWSGQIGNCCLDWEQQARATSTHNGLRSSECPGTSFLNIYIYIYVYMFLYLDVYIYMYICIYT